MGSECLSKVSIWAAIASFLIGCQRETAPAPSEQESQSRAPVRAGQFLHQPLVSHIYTADPSAHVFDGRIYIYPSHDIESGVIQEGDGGIFDMRDYRVLSMDRIGGDVTDHGVALDVDGVPWAERQLWAPDAAEKNGKYYLYFPAKDEHGVFRIGVAVSDRPAGPFKAEPEPIKRSFSVDPAVFEDREDEYYLYWGGIWGGQLQRWTTGEYQGEDVYPVNDEPALTAKVARLSTDMLSLAEAPRDVLVLDENGKPLTAGDTARRFFEGAWVHKHRGKYYFSYATGDTHFIVYAIGDSPYGPFTYAGKVLEPVLGWTTQHSIVEIGGKWYLFYHDSQLSGGKVHLRNVKVAELTHNEDGRIETLDVYHE